MSRKQSSGFTLIELAIVVAIVGILMAVAFGFYGDNVISSNRTEGRSGLQQAAGQLEKCRSLYGSYNHANCTYADFRTESNLYDISAARLATSFTAGGLLHALLVIAIIMIAYQLITGRRVI